MFEVSQYLPEDRLVGLSNDKSSKIPLIDFTPTYWCPHCDVVTHFDIPEISSESISSEAKISFDKNTNNVNEINKYSDFKCVNCHEEVRVVYKNGKNQKEYIPLNILVYENADKRLDAITEIRNYNIVNRLYGFLSGGMVSAVMSPMLAISLFFAVSSIISKIFFSLLFLLPVAFWYREIQFLVKNSKEFAKYYWISLTVFFLFGIAIGLFKDAIGFSFLLVYFIGFMIFSFFWQSSAMTEQLKSELYDYVKLSGYKDDYSGVSFFERLYKTQLYEQFKAAVKLNNKERMKTILMRVDYNEKEALHIINNPKKFGF